jgi:hypothetical protein
LEEDFFSMFVYRAIGSIVEKRKMVVERRREMGK